MGSRGGKGYSGLAELSAGLVITVVLPASVRHTHEVSSTSDSSDTEHEKTPWEDLTSSRQRVALTVAHLDGPATFERPDLKERAEESSDLHEIIDDTDRVYTSLKYTTLLNELVDDGYLELEFQGGKNPIYLDTEYDSDRDRLNAAPFGDSGKFFSVVNQILDREGIPNSFLDSINTGDFNAVKYAINRRVGRSVLIVYSDPSRYRFHQEAYMTVAEAVSEARAGD